MITEEAERLAARYVIGDFIPMGIFFLLILVASYSLSRKDAPHCLKRCFTDRSIVFLLLALILALHVFAFKFTTAYVNRFSLFSKFGAFVCFFGGTLMGRRYIINSIHSELPPETAEDIRHIKTGAFLAAIGTLVWGYGEELSALIYTTAKMLLGLAGLTS